MNILKDNRAANATMLPTNINVWNNLWGRADFGTLRECRVEAVDIWIGRYGGSRMENSD